MASMAWVIVVICVALLVIFIVYSENCMAMFRSCVRWGTVDPDRLDDHPSHVGFCHELQPTPATNDVGPLQITDPYTTAAGIGAIGGVLSGQTPVEPNPRGLSELFPD